MTESTDRTAVSPQAASTLRNAGQPIVLEYKSKKKKKKKRYSKGLGDFQRVEGRLSRVNRRIAKAVAEGASTYEKERKRSARKKKDGAIRDFAPNLGEAMSASLREASSVPVDVANALNTKSTRRLLRNQIRLIAGPLRVGR
jgi:hypothetical protein